jgi:HEAT repeat protein
MSGAGRVLAARQTAQLIMRLPETLRDSLMRAALRALAPDAEGGEALEAFASTFAAHPVLRVMRQLAAEGVPLSRHAQRLVELLASTRPTSDDADAPSPRDLETLRSELITLFREEDIDRYNPEDHLALLARSMLAWPTRTPVQLGTLETLGDRVASLTDDAVSRQLTETLLDLLSRHGDDKTASVLARLEQLVEGALARGALDEAAGAIQSMARLAADEATPEATRAALRGHLERFTRAETLSVLAAALGTPGGAPGPVAVRLVRLLGPGAIRGLLQVLVEEQVRVRRRRVFDLLSALGADVVPETTRWLGDPNWYVVRNMIALLRAVGDRSSLATVRRLTAHADLRVRLEALRSLLELDPAVGHGYLLAAIADPDLRASTAAVELAGQLGDPAMVEPLLELLAPWDLRGRRRAVRVAALHALGRVGRPEALPRLARYFRTGWGPFPPAAERRAAYESLHGYPPDARFELVERGARSRDPEIRAICERLRRSG